MENQFRKYDRVVIVKGDYQGVRGYVVPRFNDCYVFYRDGGGEPEFVMGHEIKLIGQGVEKRSVEID